MLLQFLMFLSSNKFKHLCINEEIIYTCKLTYDWLLLSHC